MRGTVTAVCTAMRVVVLRIWQMQARGPPWRSFLAASGGVHVLHP